MRLPEFINSTAPTLDMDKTGHGLRKKVETVRKNPRPRRNTTILIASRITENNLERETQKIREVQKRAVVK